MALSSKTSIFINNMQFSAFIPKRNYNGTFYSYITKKSNFRLCLGLAAGSAAAMIIGMKYTRQLRHTVSSSNSSCYDPIICSNNPLKGIFQFPRVEALRLMPKRPTEDHVLKGLKLNHRERRFMKFASVEHQGQLYMTPQDFIESVTDSEPRPRLKRRVLTENDLERFASETLPLNRGSKHMFRTIYDKEPQTGFRIAFNMFDTDGNQRVDKQEFQVLLHLLTIAAFKDFKTWVSNANKHLPNGSEEDIQATLRALEKIFSSARKDRLSRAMEGVAKSSAASKHSSDDVDEMEDELQKSHSVDTTLLIHFFGKKGKQDLKFEEFKTFMENLQTEVLEIEFNEFSKGLPTISELDFAKILLRYTYLGSDQYEMYLERLLDRLPEEKGITFGEFKSFCQFLNTLDDFSIAMKMYTLADQPISQDEFHRAVKICTGQELSAHIVDTVFKIFDDDGDGQLSYKEFIAIMRNRLHRGFKVIQRETYRRKFKACMVKNYYATRKDAFAT